MKKKHLMLTSMMLLSSAYSPAIDIDFDALVDDILDEDFGPANDDGFDPTFASSVFSKTQEDKKKEMNEYEAFNNMHMRDGTLNKCVLKL